MAYQSCVAQHDKTNLSVHRHYVLSKILKTDLKLPAIFPASYLNWCWLLLVSTHLKDVYFWTEPIGTWKDEMQQMSHSDQRDVFMLMWAIILAADCRNPSCVVLFLMHLSWGEAALQKLWKTGFFKKKDNILEKKILCNTQPSWGAPHTQFESSCRFIKELYLVFFKFL